MTAVPCDDCIDGISPYNPLNWLYTSDRPDGYNAQTGANAPTLCASGPTGDVNLGIIPNLCSASDPTPQQIPIAVSGYPYQLINKDCGSSLFSGCVGQMLGMPGCGISSNQNPYGRCGLPWTNHYWYARNWGAEMQLPSPEGTEFGNMETYCCFLPPTNLSDGSTRTKQCPPNLWYGAAKCQAPAASYCSVPAPSANSIMSWDANCDYYVQQNLQTANGKPAFAKGVFLQALSAWSSQFEGTTTSPSPNDPFVQTILKWGPSFGGSLTGPLTTACSNVTRDQIGGDSTGVLGKLCSCYLPPSEYYLSGIIPKECDALCSLASSSGGIPIYQASGTGQGLFVPKVCEQTTCVIDQVALNYSKTVAGDVDFTQICGSCSSGSAAGSCTCIVNGIDYTSINSELPGVNITQECGSFSSANGGVIPPVSARAIGFWTKYKWWILGGLAVTISLFLFFLIRKV